MADVCDALCVAIGTRLTAGSGPSPKTYELARVYTRPPEMTRLSSGRWPVAVVRFDRFGQSSTPDLVAWPSFTRFWRVEGSVLFYLEDVRKEFRVRDCRDLLNAVRAWLTQTRRLGGAALSFDVLGGVASAEELALRGVLAHGSLNFAAIVADTWQLED